MPAGVFCFFAAKQYSVRSKDEDPGCYWEIHTYIVHMRAKQEMRNITSDPSPGKERSLICLVSRVFPFAFLLTHTFSHPRLLTHTLNLCGCVPCNSSGFVREKGKCLLGKAHKGIAFGAISQNGTNGDKVTLSGKRL
ncbi:hypothetical protein KQX54_020637 [Cotesia glomerata]|uniref:Uncharacterized protein n=1 Tax=Cotesia glomerata TaxID=32391 RepID=A0AAV7I4V9_COTGL|nr:hypothetical protein KQX54_020637 [Cotesia glomerata]